MHAAKLHSSLIRISALHDRLDDECYKPDNPATHTQLASFTKLSPLNPPTPPACLLTSSASSCFRLRLLLMAPLFSEDTGPTVADAVPAAPAAAVGP
jgi:hypothetical protein